MNILVAFGGVSPEHEVSVITAIQVINALYDLKHNVTPLYITKEGKWFTGDQLSDISNYQDLKKLQANSTPCWFNIDSDGKPHLQVEKKGLFTKTALLNIDLVIPAFHGSEGENGSFQGICEVYNFPYTGCSHTASAIGMDKDITKRLCRDAGIPVTDSVTFNESEWTANKNEIIGQIEELHYPLFIKPCTLGSSIGVAKAKNRSQLNEEIETAFRYDFRIIVEQAIDPLTEINCSVLGDYYTVETSVCEMPKGSDTLLSFDDKYLSNSGTSKGMASADRIIPAPVSDLITQTIQQLSIQVFKTLGATGLARLDFLMNSKTEKIYFNEINTIPGSFSFYLWDKSGYSFPKLLEKLITIALNVHHDKTGRVRSYETNLLSQKSSQGIKGLKGLKK